MLSKKMEDVFSSLSAKYMFSLREISNKKKNSFEVGEIANIFLITNNVPDSEFGNLHTSNHSIYTPSLEENNVTPILHIRNEAQHSQVTSRNYTTNTWQTGT